MKSQGRRIQGFTLIEMLVVIAIIALLASLIVPAVNRALAKAQSVKCMANLRSIGQGIMIVAQDKNQEYPLGLVGSSAANRKNWVSQLRKEYFNMDSDVITDQGRDNSGVFLCPSAAIKGGDHHYSCHPVVMPFRADADQPGRGYPLGSLPSASSTILVADAAQRPVMGGSADAQFWTVGWAYQAYNPSASDNNSLIDPGPNMDSDSPPARANFRWRHDGGRSANFLFADGHVESRRIGKVTRGELRVPAL